MSVEVIVACAYILTYWIALGRGFGKYEKAFGTRQALQVPPMDLDNTVERMADIGP